MTRYVPDTEIERAASLSAQLKRVAATFGGDEQAAKAWMRGEIEYPIRPGAECESCAEGGIHGVPATTRSKHPDFEGYNLCAECAAEYDSRI